MSDQGARGPWRPWGVSSRKRNDGSGDRRAEKQGRPTWNMGMLNDKETIEVPGSVLLLAQDRNEPLGLRNAPARTSHSSLPTGYVQELPPTPAEPEDDKKKTKDGQIILDPQPDDSHNDPLNWPAWRRDSALLSLGLYCMVGGGITPIIAAGFTDVAEAYNIDVAEVSLTTGLYMTGLGIGCVIFSPTAILYGKRPVYLFSSILFILSAVWCAMSPNFTSLILARIFQGIAVSPVECLPSATIAEIFFLHERAFRIGIYTLLLLGGKNLVPLVSAVVIESLGWRWVFWIVAIVVGFCGALLFLLVPETFWDRSPIPRKRKHPKRPSLFSRRSSARTFIPGLSAAHDTATNAGEQRAGVSEAKATEDHHQKEAGHSTPHRNKNIHVGFAPDVEEKLHTGNESKSVDPIPSLESTDDKAILPAGTTAHAGNNGEEVSARPHFSRSRSSRSALSVPESRNPDALTHNGPSNAGYFDAESQRNQHIGPVGSDTESEKISLSNLATVTRGQAYTHALREAPAKSFRQQLKLHHGRLNQDKWWKAAVRPFILFSYPSVLWAAVTYSCSVGWLIVISESVAVIYREGHYHFNALATGLVYISPFIGGVLGTAVAGKVSDVIVKAMSRRNGGLYEPEFRLVMAAPVAVTTVVGLMGFGWSADVNDPWIVPTIFFGVVSFGCSLGSTTAITFCVDSYRQYAGEALVTLNFSKNIFHGLVFSLFVTEWLTHDGSKTVFMWIGIIQLIALLFTIPMYIYGKRARMWTVRKNFMEKF
ncbi:major facilitator superfamily domain-containing protein [Xylariomycetidae sp. FL2044]|nr:major facilitator superfamily domain-containing protein [Xylariomycetidae sp. FL2044]